MQHLDIQFNPVYHKSLCHFFFVCFFFSSPGSDVLFFVRVFQVSVAVFAMSQSV